MENERLMDRDLTTDGVFPGKFLRSYSKGEIIFEEGSAGSHMYVISRGKVNIVRRSNGQIIQMSVLDKGNMFGEMALVDNLPRSATAIAAEDGTGVLEIDHALFVYIVGQQPAFALAVIKTLSLRLRTQMLNYGNGQDHGETHHG